MTDLYKNATVAALAARIGAGASNDTLVDLQREAELSSDFVAAAGARCRPARAVLLTGATGFVGRFLLSRLLHDTDATVHCLVRAQSHREAMARVRLTLSRWDLWRAEFDGRLVVLAGDLRGPRLGLDEATFDGLCRSIDEIYHCGTSMNHLETYAMAKAANVDSAREIIRLATRDKSKLVNYISTLGVFAGDDTGSIRSVDETTSIDAERHPSASGYTASKWVGDKVFLMAGGRGISCNIFRLGLVWADTEKGRYDEMQREYRILKSCILAGCGIANYRPVLPPTPVDYVARAVVCLARRHSDGGGVFHISAPHALVNGIFERCNEIAGTSLELVQYYDWIQRIKRLHQQRCSLPAVPLLEFAFSMDRAAWQSYERSLPRMSFDCRRTRAALEQAGIAAAVLDDHLLRRCVDDMMTRDAQLRDLAEPSAADLAMPRGTGGAGMSDSWLRLG